MTINIGGTFGLFRGSQPSGSLERRAGTTGGESQGGFNVGGTEEKNKESKTNRKKEKNKWQSGEPVMSEPKNANHVGGK